MVVSDDYPESVFQYPCGCELQREEDAETVDNRNLISFQYPCGCELQLKMKVVETMNKFQYPCGCELQHDNTLSCY